MKKFGAPGDEAGNAGGEARNTGGEARKAGSEAGQAAPGHDPPSASHIDVLKALADPLRLNMLHALTRGRGPDVPAKTVKELATELGEPQTKLYRHIKHLEAAGLIHAAASRVVSGIVEYRYQASHGDMIMGDDLTDNEKVSPEAEAMAAAALELYRRQFFATRRTRLGAAAADEQHRRMVLAMADGMVPVSRAAAIYDLLYQLLEEVARSDREMPADGGGEPLVSVDLLLGYFSQDPTD